MVRADALNLASLEQGGSLSVRHQPLDWNTGWNNVLQISLYQKGPDISEVGSTWLQNIRDMRAVRPFTPAEVRALGGQSAFMESSLDRETPDGEVVLPGPRQLFSIPWILDTRMVHYRRDLLAKAGIAEAGAFSTPEALYETLERLRAAGFEYPLSLATSGLTLHNLACFVWGRGGMFRSRDYRKVALVEPEARRGMYDFFRLHTFIHPEARCLDYQGSDDRYFNGQSAVTITGQWAMQNIKDRTRRIQDVVAENTGWAKIPGVPYLGGTHLVVWRHTIHDDAVLQLLQHLTSLDTLNQIFALTGNFPARMEALRSATFSNDPDYQLVIESLESGQCFRSAHLWAGVEMRLSALCFQLWTDLFANPDLDLRVEIEQRVQSLAVRLEKTLLASW